MTVVRCGIVDGSTASGSAGSPGCGGRDFRGTAACLGAGRTLQGAQGYRRPSAGRDRYARGGVRRYVALVLARCCCYRWLRANVTGSAFRDLPRSCQRHSRGTCVSLPCAWMYSVSLTALPRDRRPARSASRCASRAASLAACDSYVSERTSELLLCESLTRSLARRVELHVLCQDRGGGQGGGERRHSAADGPRATAQRAVQGRRRPLESLSRAVERAG